MRNREKIESILIVVLLQILLLSSVALSGPRDYQSRPIPMGVSLSTTPTSPYMTAGTAGDLVYIINTGSNTITITDTGTLKLSGNAALGQYDTLLLWSDGTNWIEVAQADN